MPRSTGCCSGSRCAGRRPRPAARHWGGGSGGGHGGGARAWQFLKRNDVYREARLSLADGAPGHGDAPLPHPPAVGGGPHGRPLGAARLGGPVRAGRAGLAVLAGAADDRGARRRPLIRHRHPAWIPFPWGLRTPLALWPLPRHTASTVVRCSQPFPAARCRRRSHPPDGPQHPADDVRFLGEAGIGRIVRVG